MAPYFRKAHLLRNLDILLHEDLSVDDFAYSPHLVENKVAEKENSFKNPNNRNSKASPHKAGSTSSVNVKDYSDQVSKKEVLLPISDHHTVEAANAGKLLPNSPEEVILMATFCIQKKATSPKLRLFINEKHVKEAVKILQVKNII